MGPNCDKCGKRCFTLVIDKLFRTCDGSAADAERQASEMYARELQNDQKIRLFLGHPRRFRNRYGRNDHDHN